MTPELSGPVKGADWNPRYVNYARAHGREPIPQLAQDKIDWPGGCMVGFVQWNRARLYEASFQIPDAFFMGQMLDAGAYDTWLTAEVDRQLAAKA